jgi:hypothetical protein
MASGFKGGVLGYLVVCHESLRRFLYLRQKSNPDRGGLSIALTIKNLRTGIVLPSIHYAQKEDSI